MASRIGKKEFEAPIGISHQLMSRELKLLALSIRVQRWRTPAEEYCALQRERVCKLHFWDTILRSYSEMLGPIRQSISLSSLRANYLSLCKTRASMAPECDLSSLPMDWKVLTALTWLIPSRMSACYASPRPLLLRVT